MLKTRVLRWKSGTTMTPICSGQGFILTSKDSEGYQIRRAALACLARYPSAFALEPLPPASVLDPSLLDLKDDPIVTPDYAPGIDAQRMPRLSLRASLPEEVVARVFGKSGDSWWAGVGSLRPECSTVHSPELGVCLLAGMEWLFMSKEGEKTVYNPFIWLLCRYVLDSGLTLLRLSGRDQGWLYDGSTHDEFCSTWFTKDLSLIYGMAVLWIMCGPEGRAAYSSFGLDLYEFLRSMLDAAWASGRPSSVINSLYKGFGLVNRLPMCMGEKGTLGVEYVARSESMIGASWPSWRPGFKRVHPVCSFGGLKDAYLEALDNLSENPLWQSVLRIAMLDGVSGDIDRLRAANRVGLAGRSVGIWSGFSQTNVSVAHKLIIAGTLGEKPISERAERESFRDGQLRGLEVMDMTRDEAIAAVGKSITQKSAALAPMSITATITQGTRMTELTRRTTSKAAWWATDPLNPWSRMLDVVITRLLTRTVPGAKLARWVMSINWWLFAGGVPMASQFNRLAMTNRHMATGKMTSTVPSILFLLCYVNNPAYAVMSGDYSNFDAGNRITMVDEHFPDDEARAAARRSRLDWRVCKPWAEKFWDKTWEGFLGARYRGRREGLLARGAPGGVPVGSEAYASVFYEGVEYVVGSLELTLMYMERSTQMKVEIESEFYDVNILQSGSLDTSSTGSALNLTMCRMCDENLPGLLQVGLGVLGDDVTAAWKVGAEAGPDEQAAALVRIQNAMADTADEASHTMNSGKADMSFLKLYINDAGFITRNTNSLTFSSRERAAAPTASAYIDRFAIFNDAGYSADAGVLCLLFSLFGVESVRRSFNPLTRDISFAHAPWSVHLAATYSIPNCVQGGRTALIALMSLKGRNGTEFRGMGPSSMRDMLGEGLVLARAYAEADIDMGSDGNLSYATPSIGESGAVGASGPGDKTTLSFEEVRRLAAQSVPLHKRIAAAAAADGLPPKLKAFALRHPPSVTAGMRTMKALSSAFTSRTVSSATVIRDAMTVIPHRSEADAALDAFAISKVDGVWEGPFKLCVQETSSAPRGSEYHPLSMSSDLVHALGQFCPYVNRERVTASDVAMMLGNDNFAGLVPRIVDICGSPEDLPYLVPFLVSVGVPERTAERIQSKAPAIADGSSLAVDLEYGASRGWGMNMELECNSTHHIFGVHSVLHMFASVDQSGRARVPSFLLTSDPVNDALRSRTRAPPFRGAYESFLASTHTARTR